MGARAGATVEPYLSSAPVAHQARGRADRRHVITTLWTHTPENMDTLSDRAANYLQR